MVMLVVALSSSILLFISSCVYLSASIQVIIGLVTNSMFTSGKILLVFLHGIRKTKIFPVSSSVEFLSNFILSFALIPRIQMVGASIGFSSISVVSFAITYYYVRKYDVLKFDWKKMVKIYSSGIAMFLLVYLLQSELLYSPLKLILYIFI